MQCLQMRIFITRSKLDLVLHKILLFLVGDVRLRAIFTIALVVWILVWPKVKCESYVIILSRIRSQTSNRIILTEAQLVLVVAIRTIITFMHDTIVCTLNAVHTPRLLATLDRIRCTVNGRISMNKNYRCWTRAARISVQRP